MACEVPRAVTEAAAGAVAAAPRAAMLVEGRSDQAAVRALASRRGRNLDDDAVAIVAVGGATDLGHYVEVLGPRVPVYASPGSTTSQRRQPYAVVCWRRASPPTRI
jgi:hypothetical protein